MLIDFRVRKGGRRGQSGEREGGRELRDEDEI